MSDIRVQTRFIKGGHNPDIDFPEHPAYRVGPEAIDYSKQVLKEEDIAKLSPGSYLIVESPSLIAGFSGYEIGVRTESIVCWTWRATYEHAESHAKQALARFEGLEAWSASKP